MNKRDIDSTWLNPILEQHLGRCAAPDELWDRIATPRFTGLEDATRHLAWALAAAMLLVAIVWGFHLRGATPMTTSIKVPVPSRASQSACQLCHVAMAHRAVPGEQTALN